MSRRASLILSCSRTGPRMAAGIIAGITVAVEPSQR
jgi:hypothetical protein